MPLYLLQCAIGALEEYEEQYYIPEMTPSNVELISRQVVDEFIELHAWPPGADD